MTADPVGMAKFEVLAEQIRNDIRHGKLKAGDKLPSHKALASQYGVALGTAQRAVQLLEDANWVVSRPTVGVFVLRPQDAGSTEDSGVPSVHEQLEAIRHRLDVLEGRMNTDS